MRRDPLSYQSLIELEEAIVIADSDQINRFLEMLSRHFEIDLKYDDSVRVCLTHTGMSYFGTFAIKDMCSFKALLTDLEMLYQNDNVKTKSIREMLSIAYGRTLIELLKLKWRMRDEKRNNAVEGTQEG